jgi:putative Holliday junction resolvase
MGNVLSIDYGDTRIGLAYAEAGVKLALPLKVLINSPKLWNELNQIIRDKDIRTILVGLPVNLDSQDTIQTKKVIDFYFHQKCFLKFLNIW